MGNTRLPGSLGSGAGNSDDSLGYGSGMCYIPGAAGRPRSVADMSHQERFELLLRKTGPRLPSEIAEEFTQLLAPEVLAAIVVTLVAWAGSHYFGVGFVVDILLVGAGFIFLGAQILYAIGDFTNAVSITYTARTTQEIDLAADHLANFIAVVGVAAFMTILTKKGLPKGSGQLRYLERARRWAATAADAGLPLRHFSVFKSTAMETQTIILLRSTNPKSRRWIEKGFPRKPKEPEFAKPSESTGLTTAKDKLQANKARTVTKKDLRSGRDTGLQYYVVDANRKTASNAKGDLLDLSGADWPVQQNQIIDPTLRKPIPGDYDLMDVINPDNTGQNMTLLLSDNKFETNFTNPITNRIARQVNRKLDQPRVLHGPEAAYGGWDRIKADEVIVAFFPDGTTTAFNRNGVIELYAQYGRKMLDVKKVIPKE